MKKAVLVFVAVFAAFFFTRYSFAGTNSMSFATTNNGVKPVVAQSTNQGIHNLNDLLDKFLAESTKEGNNLQSDVTRLFYLLAMIQLAISGIYMMLGGGWGEAGSKLFKLFFGLAFFYALISLGSKWIPDLLCMFFSFGKTATGIKDLSPMSIFAVGIRAAGTLYYTAATVNIVSKLYSIGDTLAAELLSIILIILFAWLAYELAATLIKSYILIALSGLFFAFGGNELTRPMSVNYFKAVIGTGLQILTLYMIVGIGIGVIEGWTSTFTPSESYFLPAMIMVGGMFILAGIAHSIPPWIAGLAGVGGYGSGQSAVGLAAAAAGGAAFAGSVSGGAAAVTAGAGIRGAGIAKEVAALTAAGGTGAAIKSITKAAGGAIKDTVAPAPGTAKSSFAANLHNRLSSINTQNAANKATGNSAPPETTGYKSVSPSKPEPGSSPKTPTPYGESGSGDPSYSMPSNSIKK
jgi:type IV secretion system protein TrbL